MVWVIIFLIGLIGTILTWSKKDGAIYIWMLIGFFGLLGISFMIGHP